MSLIGFISKSKKEDKGLKILKLLATNTDLKESEILCENNEPEKKELIEKLKFKIKDTDCHEYLDSLVDD